MSTLSEIIAENARKLGAKPCVIIPGSEATLTYEELDQRATRFAQFLAQSGCTRGTRVLIAIHNTPESFVALVGTMRAAMVAMLRFRKRLMHDGSALSPSDAIKQHRNESERSRQSFDHLDTPDRQALLEFLGSL